MSITREKRVSVGMFQFAVGMSMGDAERLRRSSVYMRLIRPLFSLTNRRKGNGARRHSNGNGHVVPPVREVPVTLSPEVQKMMDRISAVDWYQVIDLPNGLTTAGLVDHRDQLDNYGLPDDMTGMRALDVATYDGFWAREMERRGAEVVAIDIETLADVDVPRNWAQENRTESGRPTGAGFQLASELLGSNVRREICSVYDLGPEKFGTFDVAFCSDLLLHLRDPLRAIENIWRVVDQFAIFADVYQPQLEGVDEPLTQFSVKPDIAMWWRPNIRCLKDMMKVARFSRVEEIARLRLGSGVLHDVHKIVLKAYR
jgi:tRNA (mo5U34)-methyltransferase